MILAKFYAIQIFIQSLLFVVEKWGKILTTGDFVSYFKYNFTIKKLQQYMKIISYNLNGIRAAIKKGFIDWLATNPADVVCIQETKAAQTDIDVS